MEYITWVPIFSVFCSIWLIEVAGDLPQITSLRQLSLRITLGQQSFHLQRALLCGFSLEFTDLLARDFY